MCLIILAKAGVDIPNGHIVEGHKSNDDGAGMAWVEDGKLEIFKTLNFEEFMKIYDEVTSRVKNSPILLHFRKKSVGVIDKESCHPFKVNDDSCFVHNGTLPTKHLYLVKDESDTMGFNKNILQGLPDQWWANEAILEILEYFIDPGRVVFMHSSGAIHIINEDDNGGHWNDKKDIWYSNYSYYKGISSLQKTKPTEHQIRCADESIENWSNNRQRQWGGYHNKEFYNKNNYDWINCPGPEDDWVCTFCGEFNWSNVEVCECGSYKNNGVICKYTKKVHNSGRTTYTQCPNCKKFTNASLAYCEECYKDKKTGETVLVNNIKQLPLLQEECSFCGKEETITYQTKYIGTTIKLCKKCETVLSNEPEMYFPKHLLNDKKANQILNKCN